MDKKELKKWATKFGLSESQLLCIQVVCERAIRKFKATKNQAQHSRKSTIERYERLLQTLGELNDDDFNLLGLMLFSSSKASKDMSIQDVCDINDEFKKTLLSAKKACSILKVV